MSSRSSHWFRGSSKSNIVHRSWMLGQGIPPDRLDGRPVIGICNTWSELTPCNAHLRELAEFVKRGVFEAGGLPVEFPVTSLGESNMRPSAMLYRNLVSMDVESTINANPIDGVVLLAGCDKTTPALLMGAASADLPTLVVSAGPMLVGTYGGSRVGSGTDLYRMSEEIRAGTRSYKDLDAAAGATNRTVGTCNSMGTASTMACLVEAMGLALPGNGTIPAVDARRRVLAQNSGVEIVGLVKRGVKLSDLLTLGSLHNAIRVSSAIGGSTNAVIHLQAVAGRLDIPLRLEDWDRLSRGVPNIVDLLPSGQGLMDDFFAAGGLQPVLKSLVLAGLIDGDLPTLTGRTLFEACELSDRVNEGVIRTLLDPVAREGGVAVLRGNLAPDGALLKLSAASPIFNKHRGRAIVFDGIDDYYRRIDEDGLDVTPSSVLVLRNCGPRGYPGMPEVANIGLPRKILAMGIRDMVRISDARMSGTAYGTVILHVSPEAAIGGPLGMVRDGDVVELDVELRELRLAVDEPILSARMLEWRKPHSSVSGYEGLFVEHVMQAHEGCDFPFLRGKRSAGLPAQYL
ncbi:dihydroxy-acid dehydratase [Aestuariivirga sp.]|uniref:dihydroxy-acid dehydratase n=1 Tax=Aestuariivirga sp. TaxID=2650926 RepID=UPI003BABA3EE